MSLRLATKNALTGIVIAAGVVGVYTFTMSRMRAVSSWRILSLPRYFLERTEPYYSRPRDGMHIQYLLHTQTNLTDIDSELQALQSGDKRKSDTSATSDEGASMTTASTSNE